VKKAANLLVRKERKSGLLKQPGVHKLVQLEKLKALKPVKQSAVNPLQIVLSERQKELRPVKLERPKVHRPVRLWVQKEQKSGLLRQPKVHKIELPEKLKVLKLA
jgi:hypothetical protein